MRGIIFGLLASVVALQAASAAPVDDVVAACDRMASRGEYCKYEKDASGGISGCTGKVCFTCPADGSRQCTQARKLPSGRLLVLKGADTLLKAMTARQRK